MERENFYILLELSIDPPENDPESIEAAISKKQSEWSRLRNHPTRGLQAQKCISMIPEIRRVMSDPNLREQEVSAAKAHAVKDKAGKIIEIDRHIDILMGKGFVSQEEIVKLAQIHEMMESDILDRIRIKKEEKFARVDQQLSLRMAKGYITEEEINKLASRHNLKPDDVKSRVYIPMLKSDQQARDIPPPRQIDRSIEKSIRENLKIVDKVSLYDFLDLHESTDLETIRTTAVEKKKQLAHTGKKDAGVTAGNILAGHCVNIFKNEESRIAYDISLAKHRLAELDSDIDISGFNNKIRPEYYEILLQKAIDFGMEKQEAERYIKDYCKRKNWRVEQPKSKNRKRLLVGLVVCFFLATLTALGLIYVKHSNDRQIRESYAHLTARVEEEKTPEQRIDMLRQYIHTHQSQKDYTEVVNDARNRIETYQAAMADEKFTKLKNHVNILIGNDDFEAARANIDKYLRSNPPSEFANKGRRELANIDILMEESAFEELSGVFVEAGAKEKVNALISYLDSFPGGKQVDAVNKMLAEISNEYYISIRNDIAVAKSNQNWQKCIDLAQGYIELYDNSNADKLKTELEHYHQQLRQQRILASLQQKSENLGDNFQQAIRVYTDYLSAYPDTPIKTEIRENINNLNELYKKTNIEKKQALVLSMIKSLGNGRFSENTEGVIRDQETGLMWTLLDSDSAGNPNCITFEAAAKYAENLSVGGYSDWRLPTVSELLTIYQTKPSFPVNEEKRYWSANNYSGYSSGWYRIVDIIQVHPDRQVVKSQMDSRECGAVRAVRDGTSLP